MVEKNEKKQKAKRNRVTWGMNLGTRIHKDKRDKRNKRKVVDDYENY